jgi:hypothetical protein
MHDVSFDDRAHDYDEFLVPRPLGHASRNLGNWGSHFNTFYNKRRNLPH